MMMRHLMRTGRRSFPVWQQAGSERPSWWKKYKETYIAEIKSMEKITNYLELIQQIQDITPEKEAFCTTGKSLTYSQLYALAKEKQGMLKQV
jgi:thiamine pyrophosphate-dependent acetolactate synthase large subunit-like protein